MALILYSYYRSSAAYRVRIALQMKGIKFQIHPVNLVKNGGEHLQDPYLQINPQGLVPALQTDDGLLTESAAIIEYLEERYPEPALLPANPADRAFVRSLAQMIACDLHPLNCPRVLNYLWPNEGFHDAKRDWYFHWIEKGFKAFEQRLQQRGITGRYSFGETPGYADLFLIPQVYNAFRFEFPLEDYPLIRGIYRNCTGILAFRNAAPEYQPDAPSAAIPH